MKSEAAAPRCDYCGRENPERWVSCRECGTPLVETPSPEVRPPQGKSRLLAVALALGFGPLGLLYVRAWFPASVIFAASLPFMITGKGRLWVMIGGRLFCAGWAFIAAGAQRGTPDVGEEANQLLNEAARLESVDFNQAIAAYEKVASAYPNTSAAKAAAQAIEVLKRNAGSG